MLVLYGCPTYKHIRDKNPEQSVTSCSLDGRQVWDITCGRSKQVNIDITNMIGYTFAMHLLPRPVSIIFVVVCLFQITGAQSNRIIDERQNRSTTNLGVWPYECQPAYPAGRFVITPDDRGSLSFDPGLAYSLQRALDSVRSIQRVMGASAAVLIPGQGIWQGVSGVSSVSPVQNITPDMLFGIGSNTKALISTTILTLADEGLLSLDDSLGNWLPAYPNITGSVKIRQLMNMTSGLFDYLNDSNKEGDSVFANPTRLWAPEEIITTFVGPPHGPPGGPYRYCNTNYVLLGMIIKKVTNSSVSAQLRQRILTPLSLDRTYLEVEETAPGPVAHPWDSGSDFFSMPVTAHYSILWTAGGVMSTAENMSRWGKALYEGTQITPTSLNQMLTFVPMSANGAPGFDWTGYGLGVRIGSFLGKQVLGHGGQVMGYVSIVAYLPQAKASFAVLLNASEPNECAFLTALLNAYLRTVPTQYAHPGLMYAVSAKSDSARVYAVDSSTVELKSIGRYLYGEIVNARVDRRTGRFWGLSNALGWELVQMDGVTGEAFPRVRIALPPGSTSDLKGMDFSPQGMLYVGGADGRIYSVDTASGAGTPIASTGIPISGLAFDPRSGALWAAVRANASLRDRLYKVNLRTGDTAGAGNTGFTQPLTDIACDEQGNLFGVVRTGTGVPNNLLARIDTVTGEGTVIGSFDRAGIQAIAFSPASIPSSVNRPLSAGVAEEFRLEQNYPNPFNASTVIRYELPVPSGVEGSVASRVRLVVYDLLGREVSVLVNERKAPGSYSVEFNASGMASGVYLYRLVAGKTVVCRKMVLMK